MEMGASAVSNAPSKAVRFLDMIVFDIAISRSGPAVPVADCCEASAGSYGKARLPLRSVLCGLKNELVDFMADSFQHVGGGFRQDDTFGTPVLRVLLAFYQIE